MVMGEIAAVRENSPGEKAGVQVPGTDHDGRSVPGDVIREVQVVTVRKGPDGTPVLRWVAWSNKDWDARAKPGDKEVEVAEKGKSHLVRELDPIRLPFELERWSGDPAAADYLRQFASQPDRKLSRREVAALPEQFLSDLPHDAAGDLDLTGVKLLLKRVVLVVERTNPLESQTHSGKQQVSLRAQWDNDWNFDKEGSISPMSPLAVPGLGIAYRIKSVVEKVRPGSPAAGKLQDGDVLKHIRFKQYDPKKDTAEWAPWGDGPEGDSWWAHVDWVLQQPSWTEVKDVTLKVERSNAVLDVELTPVQDNDWPLDERGLDLMPDVRLQRADNVWTAITLGIQRTYRSVYYIYLNLYGIVSGRLSPKMLGGPIMIASVAYELAGENFYKFVWLMGFISINLAVINFLPIPVLDGGHMVFLIYEKLRGRPASEPVRALATYVGLAIIASLMLFVIFLDAKRQGWLPF
jgi:regulator of sigma E protease